MRLKLSHILKILTLSTVIGLTAMNPLYAQGTKIKAQTIEQFAAEKKGELEALADKAGKYSIICGKDICDNRTQKCASCPVYGDTVRAGAGALVANVEKAVLSPLDLVTGGWTSEVLGLNNPTTYMEIGTHSFCVDKNTDIEKMTPPETEWKFRGLKSGIYSYGTCYEAKGFTTDYMKSLYGTDEKENCRKGQDQKRYCFSISTEGGVTLSYAQPNTNFKGCEVLPVKLYRMSKCFFCPLFGTIYKAADKMAVTAYSKFAVAFATVIALGLAIWIAVQTLTHVGSLTKQDGAKFLGNLLKQSFKFMIAFLLLMYGTEIYTKAINPLLQSGIDFGQKMLFQPMQENKKDQISYVKEGETKLLTVATFKKLQNYLTGVQYKIGFMQSVGTSLICIGSNKMMAIGGNMEFGTGFVMLAQGIVLAMFGFLLSLAFAFYLIDAVVQLGILGALMPFLVASWPFKLTSKFAKTGFSMLLNSCFVFVFVGMVATINFELIDEALGVTVSASQEADGNKTATAATQKDQNVSFEADAGSLEKIAAAINEQDNDKLKELTDITGVGFLILLFCSLFGFKLCGKSTELADKMAGGGLSGLGTSVGTMGASAVTSAAKKVSAPIRKSVGERVEKGTTALLKAPVSAPMAAVRGIRNMVRGGKGNAEADKEEKEENGGNPKVVNNAGKNRKGLVQNKEQKSQSQAGGKDDKGQNKREKMENSGKRKANKGQKNGSVQNNRKTAQKHRKNKMRRAKNR